MTDAGKIADADLHAYVDGELDAASATEVERWLADHPEDAARVHEFKLQKRLMHEVYDDGLEAPWPAGVEEMLTAAPARAWWPGWQRLAAAIVLLVVGAGVGFGITRLDPSLIIPPTETAEKGFVERAMTAHAVYTHDSSRPVEVSYNEEKLLVDWLSSRLGHKLMTPDLSTAGFSLMGGRLVADAGVPAAQFMYHNAQGKRVTLYVRSAFEDENTAFRFIAEDGMVAFYWTDHALSYALTGEMKPRQVLHLAQMVYADIEKRL